MMSDSDEELDFQQANDLVHQRQRFKRKPRRSADIIARLMARKGYAQQQSADELIQAWARTADSGWRSQTRVGTIRRGVLEIVVGNSVLNQRLEFEKQKLLRQMADQLPHAGLKDIRFRIGNVN